VEASLGFASDGISQRATLFVDRRVAIPVTWVGVALIVFAALAFDDSTPYPGSAALLPVAGAVAIIAAGCAASSRLGAEALLGTAPFQRIGAWSYSWYLWHWPVLIPCARRARACPF
jgi:peptidoglycan/LPS O-acetylase OafA/YrhL